MKGNPLKKYSLYGLLLLCCLPLAAATGPKFDEYFLNKCLRVDLFMTGTKTKTVVSLDEIIEEPIWAGSLSNLIDTLDMGHHRVEVFDKESGILLYSHGFSSVYGEWQTTEEAAREIYRTFSLSVLVPFPHQPIELKLLTRDRKNQFIADFTTTIDPNSRFTNRDKPKGEYKAHAYLKNGSPNEKVDILILPEGYTRKEMSKFKKDLKRLMQAFFNESPFRENRDKFNVWYLEVASEESGIDDPRQGVFVKSAFDLSYNSLDVDRYVLTLGNKNIRDIAANAPYDQLYFLMNSPKYGGGGIYNLYSTCYSHDDNEGNEWWPEYVFVHEFGHAFGGLADEYYSSEVAYDEFHPKDVEPWEPNITALLKPPQLKWKTLMDEGTPLPTPWRKEEYDNIPYKESAERSAFLRQEKYWGTIGAFQGAGYASEGLYRPYLDCRMFSKSLNGFCPVCRDAISRVIGFYSE